MKLKLNVEVEYDLNGASKETLVENLKYIASNAAGNGLMSADTEAEVTSWKSEVTSEPPKIVISVIGGVADVQSAPEDVEVVIIDHDNLKEEGHYEECEKRTIGSNKCTCGADAERAEAETKDVVG